MPQKQFEATDLHCLWSIHEMVVIMTPPNPGKGYRLLKVGEVISFADQVQSVTDWKPGWRRTIKKGTIYSHQSRKDYGLFYRRKLKTKAKK